MLKISTRPASLRPLRLGASLGFTLCILGWFAAGCGDETTGGGGSGGSGGSASSTNSSSSSKSTSSSSGSSVAASSSGSGSATHSVKFTVDTTKVTAFNTLAAVISPEQVFLVGAFNGWNPQDPAYAMRPVAGQLGKFSITLTFPRDSPDGMLDTGAAFEYKYAKTTDRLGPNPPADPWGNGQKAFFTVDATHPCTNFPAATAGLFEISNLKITIPAGDMEFNDTVDAWRDYAESFGFKTCN
jgi:hypothetical protein